MEESEAHTESMDTNQDDKQGTVYQIFVSEESGLEILAEAGEEEDDDEATSIKMSLEEDEEEEVTYIRFQENQNLSLPSEEGEPLFSIEATEGSRLNVLLDAKSCRMDFPIFTVNGLCWSSKLLLGSMSLFLRDVLEEADCLVIPEITKKEYLIFHSALFAKENDYSLDFLNIIKVAQIIGVQINMTMINSPSVEQVKEINYEAIASTDTEDWKRLVCNSSTYDKRTLSKNSNLFDNLSKLLNSKEINCEVCQRSFYDEASKNKHYNLLHNSKSVAEHIRSKSSYACSRCDRSFSFGINLKKHMWLFHRTVKQKKILQSTIEESPRLSSITEDIGDNPELIKEQKRKEKFEDMRCSVCRQYFLTWKQLQIHMMDHTQERPFKCDLCGKGFKEISKLRRHAMSHSGERNFKCRFCEKRFSLKHNKATHERIHTGEGVHCRYCGRTYSQAPNLRLHEKIHSKKKHVISSDPDIQLKQRLTAKRGRPSLNEKFITELNEEKSSNTEKNEPSKEEPSSQS